MTAATMLFRWRSCTSFLIRQDCRSPKAGNCTWVRFAAAPSCVVRRIGNPSHAAGRPQTSFRERPEKQRPVMEERAMSTSGRILATWTRCRRFLNWETALGVAGAAALVLWCAVWASSIQHHRLRGGQWTWFPGFQYLGVDFLSGYQAARHWLDGGDPYREPFGDPLDRPVCYPRVILPFFAWTHWLRPYRATVLGIAALALLAGLGAWVSWRTRQRLGLQRVPRSFVLAAVLCSTP